jgi:hypothetical protein
MGINLTLLLRAVLIFLLATLSAWAHRSTVHAGAAQINWSTSYALVNLSASTNRYTLAGFSSAAGGVGPEIASGTLAGWAARFYRPQDISTYEKPSGSGLIISQQPVASVSILSNAAAVNTPVEVYPSASSSIVIPTVLKNTYDTDTKLFVVPEAQDLVTFSIAFYALGSTLPTHTENIVNAVPYHAYYLDAAGIAALGGSFNGSAVATITSGNGKLRGGALELGISTNAASAFAAASSVGSTKSYMASALCNAFGGTQKTAYAIANVSGTANASVSVTFQPAGGGTPVTTPVLSISPRNKVSVLTCNYVAAPFNGSAVVNATGANVVSVMKVYDGGANTASLAPSAGMSTIGLPYIKWCPVANYDNGGNRRTFISVQNVGAAAVNGAYVRFYNSAGTQIGTDVAIPQLQPGAKANPIPSNVNEWIGYSANSTTETPGAAIVYGPAGSSLIAVVRTSKKSGGQEVSEDYVGN